MHQPNTSSVGGRCFSVRGLASPDMAAAAATALSTSSKGSPPAATYSADCHRSPRTLSSPDSIRSSSCSESAELQCQHSSSEFARHQVGGIRSVEHWSCQEAHSCDWR